MAFIRDGLYCANPSAPPGSRIWTYQSLDTHATMDTVGYFNNAARELGLGDKIETTVVTGSIKAPTGITARGTTYVNSLAAAAVDVVDIVVHAATDSD